jgi:hypothetical protein
LASMSIKTLQEELTKAVESDELDAYSQAHLKDSLERVKKFIDSQYVFNTNNSSSGMGGIMFLGQPAEKK